MIDALEKRSDVSLLQCEAADNPADLLITQYVRDIVGPDASSLNRSYNNNSLCGAVVDKAPGVEGGLEGEAVADGGDFCGTVTSGSSVCESLHNDV